MLERNLMDSLVIEYVGKVPSINSCYVNIKNRGRILSSEGKSFKRHVELLCKQSKPIRDCTWYKLEVGFRMPLFFKNGRVRKYDLSNHLKLLEDAMCSALGIDDSQIIKIVTDKSEGEWGFKARMSTF